MQLDASKYKVSPQCRRKWLEFADKSSGLSKICLCGHPTTAHSETGLCEAGISICCCRKPNPALIVLDGKYFFRATKGHHEGHALELGRRQYEVNVGKADELITWACSESGCQNTNGVSPVRMSKGTSLYMGLSPHERHKLLCERCLFVKLNGHYIDG